MQEEKTSISGGVNDGTSNFDAVNVSQFSSAMASVTAMANIPQVDQDKTYAYGVGVGGFMGKTALAAGVTYRSLVLLIKIVPINNCVDF